MVDFQETFAPTVWWESIQAITALAAFHGWPIHHMDAATAFLYGCLYTKPFFMLQPPSCVRMSTEHLVYKLNHLLYGLGKAPAPSMSALAQTYYDGS